MSEEIDIDELSEVIANGCKELTKPCTITITCDLYDDHSIDNLKIVAAKKD